MDYPSLVEDVNTSAVARHQYSKKGVFAQIVKDIALQMINAKYNIPNTKYIIPPTQNTSSQIECICRA